MKTTLKQGDLENIILNALWDLETEGQAKIFVSDIQERIKLNRADSKEWAYTTVKTVLDRLVDKELTNRTKEGKKFMYRSVVQRDQAGLQALTKLIHQYFQDDISALETSLQTVRQNKAFASKPAIR